jgi:rhamnosyltransferase
MIPTYNAAATLPVLLPHIFAAPEKPKVLVLDSSSRDGTADLARRLGANVHVIPQHEFNHGSTRELGRRLLGTDIAIMMTQDAIPTGPDVIANLVAPIEAGQVSIAYGRQLPHDGAGFFEAFPREFNYPAKSEIRSIEDVKRIGSVTFFVSDSCCAWLNSALDSIGGFRHTLSLEDSIATAELLKAGHKIAYCADAVVKHSHCYGLIEEFCHYFDVGYVRAEHKKLFHVDGGDERRGAQFFSLMIKRLAKESPHFIPYAFLSTTAKYLGYKVGFHGRGLPVWLKKRLSAQSFYWTNCKSPERCG